MIRTSITPIALPTLLVTLAHVATFAQNAPPAASAEIVAPYDASQIDANNLPIIFTNLDRDPRRPV